MHTSVGNTRCLPCSGGIAHEEPPGRRVVSAAEISGVIPVSIDRLISVIQASELDCDPAYTS